MEGRRSSRRLFIRLGPSRPYGGDRRLQRWKIVVDDFLNFRHIDPVVLVREDVPKPGDLSPRYFGTVRFGLLAKGFDGFAEDQQVVEERVSPDAFGGPAICGVRLDRRDRLGNVVEPLPVAALQTGRASRIARSRTRSFIIRGAATSTPTPRISSASC